MVEARERTIDEVAIAEYFAAQDKPQSAAWGAELSDTPSAWLLDGFAATRGNHDRLSVELINFCLIVLACVTAFVYPVGHIIMASGNLSNLFFFGFNLSVMPFLATATIAFFHFGFWWAAFFQRLKSSVCTGIVMGGTLFGTLYLSPMLRESEVSLDIPVVFWVYGFGMMLVGNVMQVFCRRRLVPFSFREVPRLQTGEPALIKKDREGRTSVKTLLGIMTLSAMMFFLIANVLAPSWNKELAIGRALFLTASQGVAGLIWSIVILIRLLNWGPFRIRRNQKRGNWIAKVFVSFALVWLGVSVLNLGKLIYHGDNLVLDFWTHFVALAAFSMLGALIVMIQIKLYLCSLSICGWSMTHRPA